MAEFCKQCAEDMGFEPDFVGLTTEEDTKNNCFAVVICEGCGPICVDHTGLCRAEDCLEHHNKGASNATQD